MASLLPLLARMPINTRRDKGQQRPWTMNAAFVLLHFLTKLTFPLFFRGFEAHGSMSHRKHEVSLAPG